MSTQKLTSSFSLNFDLLTGLSPTEKSLKRCLSNMHGMFLDEDALSNMIKKEDRLIYEFYDLKIPSDSGEIAFGTSIIYPGKVGNEFFMTKGHFHSIIDTAEVYYCLRGHGIFLMENPIETKGFRKLVVDKNGKVEIVDNPRWTSNNG
ncbi:MAG: glucose-6-phosphate isomerase family protein [Spirochaetota bacterium]